MSRLYKNPPLIEAIFEIRFPAELSIECQRDRFYEKIRNVYPQIFVPIVVGESPSLKSYEFRSSEGKKIIRCSINRFSIHTNKYEGFAKFEEDCLKYIQLFTKLYNITSLKRTGLRYINHIPIVRIEGCIPIQKYLKFGYPLPSDLGLNKFELFDTTFITKIGEGKLRLLARYLEVPSAPQREFILLDFDYYYEGELRTGKILDYLRKSHTHTKRIFEDIISDEYKMVMEIDLMGG